MNHPGADDDAHYAALAAVAADIERLDPGWLEVYTRVLRSRLARQKMTRPKRRDSRP